MSQLILIVDDNPANLKLARVLLSGEGYEIRTANDAEEAVQVLLTFRPRMILMDLQLPRMSGLEAIRIIRGEDPGARVVVLTMYQGDEDIHRALQATQIRFNLPSASVNICHLLARPLQRGEQIQPLLIFLLPIHFSTAKHNITCRTLKPR